MQESSLVILYLLSFRLSVIFVGLAAIVLGYKLFSKGIEHQGKGKESITAEIGNHKLEFMNIAPGTGFALFGATLIIVMLIKAPPQVTIKQDTSDYRGQSSISEPQRSTCQWDITENTPPEHIETCWNTMAVTLNNHAWHLHQRHANPQLAQSLSKLAVVAYGEGQLAKEINNTFAGIHGIYATTPDKQD